MLCGLDCMGHMWVGSGGQVRMAFGGSTILMFVLNSFTYRIDNH